MAAVVMVGAFITPAQAHVVYAKHPDELAQAWTNTAHTRVGVQKMVCAGDWARADGRFNGVWKVIGYDYTCGTDGEGFAVPTGLEYIRACFKNKNCGPPQKV
jgi:hypothetical protein